MRAHGREVEGHRRGAGEHGHKGKEKAEADQKTKKRKGEKVQPEAEAEDATARKHRFTGKTAAKKGAVAGCKATGELTKAAAAKTKALKQNALAAPKAKTPKAVHAKVAAKAKANVKDPPKANGAGASVGLVCAAAAPLAATDLD